MCALCVFVGRRGRHIISFFRSTSIRKFPLTSMEVGGSRFTFMEVGGIIFISMEVRGCFHGKTWRSPLSVEVEASIASINLLQFPRICSVEASMRFYVPLHRSTYFHEYHNLPAPSTRLP